MQQAMSRLKSQQQLGREERRRARKALAELPLEAPKERLRKSQTIQWWSGWISAMETATDVVRICPCKHGQGGYDEIFREDVAVSRDTAGG